MLMDPFLVKPRKNEFEGYYDMIKQPMDFKTITARTKKRVYSTLEAFEADWSLMFQNARTYNADDTLIYQV